MSEETAEANRFTVGKPAAVGAHHASVDALDPSADY